MAAEPASSGPSAWGGMLTLTPGAVLYRGPGGNADLHAHHAVQVLITLDGPFVLEFADSSLEASAAVVPSGLPHRLRCTSRDALLMLVEPLGPPGRGLGAGGSPRPPRRGGAGSPPPPAPPARRSRIPETPGYRSGHHSPGASHARCGSSSRTARSRAFAASSTSITTVHTLPV